MKKSSTQFVVYGGLIAALYVVLTLVSQLFGLASGVIQVRLSESEIDLIPLLREYGGQPRALTSPPIVTNGHIQGVPGDTRFTDSQIRDLGVKVLDPAGSQQCDYYSDRADLCLSCTGCMVVPGTDSRGR